MEYSAAIMDAGQKRRARRSRAVVERAGNGWFEWRLKAPNGRIVAVSQAVYQGRREAEQGLIELRHEGAQLVERMRHVREGGGWFWLVLSDQGVPQVRSLRSYERYATSHTAFRKFLELLDDSTPRD